MQEFLYHDLIIAGNWCNLKCQYCSSVADADEFGHETSASRRGKGATIATAEVLDMVDALNRRVDAPVIKLSGGELFLLANAVELIEALAERYDHVQVLTNGTELDPDIVERVAATGRCSFNLSLDGHTPGMNRHRWKSERIHARVMSAFAAIVATTGRMEITAVISGANAPDFACFLDFLADQPCRIVTIPTPVRGLQALALFSLEERHAFAGALPGMVARRPEVLGPRAYYAALARFMASESGQRQHRCHLVKASVQLFDTGALTPCPVGWTVALGNLKSDDPEIVLDEIGRHRMYDLLTRDPPRVPVCRTCFSQADIVNLYVEGAISDAEIAEMPLFSAPRARARLASLRRSVPTEAEPA